MTTHTHGPLSHAHNATPGQPHRHGRMTLGNSRPTKFGPPAVWNPRDLTPAPAYLDCCNVHCPVCPCHIAALDTAIAWARHLAESHSPLPDIFERLG